jgi:hypothetical protein
MLSLKKIQYENIILLFSYLSLLAGFFFNEDMLGEGKSDYLVMQNSAQSFNIDFFFYFKNYHLLGERHSPVFLIIESLFHKLKINDSFFRLIFLHLNILIIIFFYFSLKFFYEKENLKILISFVLISPAFRAGSVWPDSFTVGLVFFVISIYFFLKFFLYKKFKYAIYNTIVLSIASYLSPNFSVFVIFFFIKFILFYNLNNKKTLYLVILNISLAMPAFYYIFFYVNGNFLDPDSAKWVKNISYLSLQNLSNKVLLNSNIFFFYFIPFLFIKKNDLYFKKIFYPNKLLIISILISALLILHFDYNDINKNLGGGGIFYKIAINLIYPKLIIFIISLISIFFILSLCLLNKNSDNSLLIFCIFISSPQLTIYHSYFEPMMLIMIFTLFRLNITKKFFQTKKHLYFFSIFYVMQFLLFFFKKKLYLYLIYVQKILL